MKKTLLVALVLAFLTPRAGCAAPDMLVGSAAAVFSTTGAVFLYAEPSADAKTLLEIPARARVTVLAETGEGYARVNYAGQRGYVLSAVLDYVVTLGGLSIRERLTDAQRANIERFLTAFAQTDFAELSQGAFSLTDASDPLLAAFAARLAARDDQETIERGTYADGCDARVSVADLAPTIERYFGIAPEDPGSGDGFFYFVASEAQPLARTAILTNIIDFENGSYAFFFDLLDANQNAIGTGRADVRAGDLAGPDGIILTALAVDD